MLCVCPSLKSIDWSELSTVFGKKSDPVPLNAKVSDPNFSLPFGRGLRWFNEKNMETIKDIVIPVFFLFSW